MSKEQMQAEVIREFCCPFCKEILQKTRTNRGYFYEHSYKQQELLENKAELNFTQAVENSMKVSHNNTYRATYPPVCENNGKYFYILPEIINSL